MQDANQDFRKAVSKIINEAGLNLTYNNDRNESDHYKSSTHQFAYKLNGKIDTASAIFKHPELHKII